jgi:hypothetical protein
MRYRIPPATLGGRRLKVKPAQHMWLLEQYAKMPRRWGLRRLDVLAAELGVHRCTVSRHINGHVKFPVRA